MKKPLFCEISWIFAKIRFPNCFYFVRTIFRDFQNPFAQIGISEKHLPLQKKKSIFLLGIYKEKNRKIAISRDFGVFYKFLDFFKIQIEKAIRMDFPNKLQKSKHKLTNKKSQKNYRNFIIFLKI